MTRIDTNIRDICGNLSFRRFAYMHKRDHMRFGLLEATGHEDARRYLGGSFYIRQTWLTFNEVHDQAHDRELRWDIVSGMFIKHLEVI